jgi:hypothetical protein
MQQHALLQRIENVLARYLLWGLRPSGGIMAVTRCRWIGNEFDEPAVLVRELFVRFRRGSGFEREGRQYFESNHTPGWRECFEC